MSSPATSPNRKLLKARFLFDPGASSRPLQQPGMILVENNRALAVDHAPGNVETIDFGDAIILPGLHNAHTHLELSNCSPGDPPGSFTEWLFSLPRRLGRPPHEPRDDLFAAATRHGIEQCLRFGVTSVGDISQQMHITRRILRDSPLSGISFGEVLGLARRRPRFEELLPQAIDLRYATDRLAIGLTPHSPYTVGPGDLKQCLEIAQQRRMPLAIHLAETPEEEQFIRSHTGAFKEMWEMLGYWEDFPGAFDGTPVAFAKSLGLLDYPTCLAHVNYCTDDDLDLLAASQATVVYCPRTHRYFGHPPHRWREMIRRGIRVQIGTDSCASSPDLNIVDDLRLLREIAPEHPVQELWRMVLSDSGLIIFDVSSDDPLGEILEDADRRPREVWPAGQRIIYSRPASPC